MRLRNEKGIGCVEAIVILIVASIFLLVLKDDITAVLSVCIGSFTEGCVI